MYFPEPLYDFCTGCDLVADELYPGRMLYLGDDIGRKLFISPVRMPHNKPRDLEVSGRRILCRRLFRKACIRGAR